MKKILLYTISVSFILIACNQKHKKMTIKSEVVHYQDDSLSLTGLIAYDSAITSKRPIVFIIHEWWGLNDYVQNRAKQLAALGYFAVAVDMYGDGENATNVEDAAKFSAPFYSNPLMAKQRFDAAYSILKAYHQADTSNIAAIGYCFGGTMVLNLAKMGEPFKGAVSFHGGLAGVPAEKQKLQSRILICHGADDKFVSVEEVKHFRREMDSIHAEYIFKEYKGATHAFSNPDATSWGKKFNIPIAYNGSADSASWDEMKMFLGKVLN